MTAATSPLTAQELRVLGRHRIIAKLGQGGMADVYLTVIQGHGVNKLFVAKVLRGDLGVDQQFQSMFLKEARVATLLHHRNLVQTFEVDVADGHHYITMEYLDGRPLHLVLAGVGRNAMPLDVHVAILALALAGLHAAHEQKDLTGAELDIVHRDVSPQNVFVTYDGEVKVVDFGVAKVRGAGGMTETGVLIGKIGYISPEQAMSEAVDRRADVFAVGIMLWEAIARRPFVDRGDGEAATLRKRLNGEIPSPRTVAPDAPAELVSICERAIAYDASARFTTAAEFGLALQGYLERKGARIDAREISATVSPPFEKDRENVRQIIEERLAGLDSAPEPGAPVAPDAEAPPAPAPASGYTARKPAPFLTRAVSAGVALALLVAAIFAIRSRGESSSSSVSPSVNVASATPPLASVPVVQPVPAASEAVVAPKKTVRVRFRVAPASAQLALDGKPLGANPFAGELPADTGGHALTATADGYVAATHDLRLDSDVDVDLTLVPVAAPANKPARPGRGRSESLRPPVRPVDDKDPYAQ